MTAPRFIRRWAAPLVLAVLLAAWTILLHVRPGTPPVSVPPNILLISVCSVRADHMSCYGYRRKTTPDFEKLARESFVFERALTQWPKTVPGFAAIMTGKYGHTTGIMRITPRQYLDDEHETLAETFRAHGYDTAAFISTPVLNERTNMLQGCGTIEETWRLPPHLSDSAATRTALAWLREPRASPFFAWVHYNNAHQPYYPIAAPRDLFVGDEFYDPSARVRVNDQLLSRKGLAPGHPYAAQITQPDMGGVHRSAILRENPNELDYYIAQYDACIRSVDRMAGKLLREAREMGLLDTTIVTLVGDHGESLGEHDYFFGHGRLPYEDSARVPLMIRPPGGTEPIRIDTPVAAFELAPTLLAMAGIEPPQDMEARSLLPIVHGVETDRSVFMECGYQMDFMLAVWHRQWKLIHVPNEMDRSWMTGSEYELYDLRHDPAELNNLHEAEPHVAGELRRALEEWSAPWVEKAYSMVGTRGLQLDAETQQRLRALGYLP